MGNVRSFPLALLATAAAVAVACSAGGDAGRAGFGAPEETSTSGAVDSATGDAGNTGEAGDASAPEPPASEQPPAPEPASAARSDGLTGAPIPPPTSASTAVDGDLVNEGAGAFPPLDYPAVVRAADAAWMAPDDLVLGALQNGEARAYPIFMMSFHHVANDRLGGQPYLVSF